MFFFSKTLIDELEQRIEICHQKGLEEGEIAQKASEASGAAADLQKKRKGGKTGKTPGNCCIKCSLVILHWHYLPIFFSIQIVP